MLTMATYVQKFRSSAGQGILYRLLASDSGVAAIEFALIAPILIMLILSGYEVMNAVGQSTRATYLSSSLGELLSQTTTTLTLIDANRIVESAPLVDADILSYAREMGRKDIWNIATITLSSVQFSKKTAACVANCEYRGDVVFSYSPGGTPLPCGQVNNGAASATLPTALIGPGSVVIVTVKVPYKPLLNVLFSQQFSFERTSYFTPRYIDTVRYQNSCPGF